MDIDNTNVLLNNKYLTKCFLNIVEDKKETFISTNINITNDFLEFNKLFNAQQEYLINKKLNDNLDYQNNIKNENDEFIKKYNDNLIVLLKIKNENDELLNKYNNNIKLISSIQNENNININELLNKKMKK